MKLGVAMEAEIEEQADCLVHSARVVEDALKYAQIDDDPELILLVARGSSDHAALFARYLFEIQLGIPVSLVAPSVITRFNANIDYPKCLAIGISQSGKAPDVAEVLNYVSTKGHRTIAITNYAESPVAEAADVVLPLSVGEERAVAATKTYTASLVALYQVARSLGANLRSPVGALPDMAWMSTCKSIAETALPSILRSERWFSLGRGYSFASASETALKMMECALLPFKSYSSADFQHGPKALAKSGTVAITFGDSIPGLGENGCLVEMAPIPEKDELSPIWEIMFGQYLALLAARARGFDPDRPENLTKVTQTF